jgi:glyoxylase-like metal-dependent hydrolase (beta-lactamase superfamily II)
MIPYFARRPAVDLLGRSDRTIARLAPRTTRFWPGHTKWDYAQGIGRLRADLIVQLWQATPEELATIKRFGNDWRLPEVFVRADSVAVDRAALKEAVCRISQQRCPAGPR